MPSYNDLDKIRDVYSKAKQRSMDGRYLYERNWFRALLNFIGIFWITWDGNNRRWRQKALPAWCPRTTTNKVESNACTIIQVLQAKQPDASVRPGTDSPEDVAAAEIASHALPVIAKEAGSVLARKMTASWLTFTGNVFHHPCYDPDPQYGSRFIPDEQCTQCKKTYKPDEVQNACPQCGGELMPAMDGNGNLIGTEKPRGKIKLEVYSPFEVYCDLEARSMDEVQELFVRRRYPVEVARAKWKDAENDYRIEPDPPGGGDEGGGRGMSYLRAIAYAAATGSPSGYGSGRSADNDQGATIDFLWKRPCDDYPNGLVAIFNNGICLNPQPDELEIPYHDYKGNTIFPWHHAFFDYVPGRMLGKTPIDSVAEKNDQLNRLDALIELIIKRTANPVWLVPKNTGITLFTGEPGQILEGNWQGDPRLRPDRIEGSNVPTSVLTWREQILQDIVDAAGTQDVLKGNVPTGVSAGSALRLLLERAITRFTPVLQNIEDLEQADSQDLLCIAQEYWDEERHNVVQGPGKRWEVQKFLGADMQGNLDVVVEAGSSAPKSSVGMQALITDLANMGAINPQEPETNYNILSQFSMTSLQGSVDDDIKHAQRENYEFVVNDVDPVVNPLVDNHMIHLREHRKVALSSDFKTWDPVKQGRWLRHLLDTQMAMAPPPMPMPAPGGQRPSGRKSGASKGQPGEPSMPPSAMGETSEAGAEVSEAPMPGGPL